MTQQNSKREIPKTSSTFKGSKNNNDKETLVKKGIISPDIREKEYRYIDPKKRITYFFSSKEKYLNFLRKHNL